MRILLLFLVIVSIVGCSSNKRIAFKCSDKAGTPITYTASLPKGFKKVEFGDQHHNGTSFIYSDSSLVFFTTDITHGQVFTGGNIIYPEDVRMKFIANDSISINGTDANGRFWKEVKAQGIIVYGYWKVPDSKKALFDSLLNEVKAVK